MKNKSDESDEVEQLLKAAQDEMLLKLSVDSHIATISSNFLNADLDRRFQALKSRPSVPQSTSAQSQTQSDRRNANVDDELTSVLGDDLSARFAALKAPPSSSSTTTTTINGNNNNNSAIVRSDHKITDGAAADDDDDGEDEVEKIIRWAKDAARLDPSPPSDDDEEDDKDSDHETQSDTDDDDEEPPSNHGRRK